jgi:hypothetical protein
MQTIRLESGEELTLTHVVDALGQSVVWRAEQGVGGLPVAQVAACITALEQGVQAEFLDDQDPLSVARVRLTRETVCLGLEEASQTFRVTAVERFQLAQALRVVVQEEPDHLD